MPAIRDGRGVLTVDSNEQRLPQGFGPVERRLASPQQMADIAAERVREERAAAPVPAPVVATHPLKGQKRSPEVRERMRQAQLARYARKRDAQRTPPSEEVAVLPEPPITESQAPEASAPATAADELPATGPADEQVATPPEPCSRAAAVVAAAEALAFDHEHGRLYEALKVAEERAELAGDDEMRIQLRQLRRRVAQHLADRVCAA